MIKNIIFDMGNVLIDFKPVNFLKREGISDPDDVALLMNEIFKSQEWLLADAGDISVEEIDKRCSARLPERLQPAAHKLITKWYEPLAPIPGMADFVRKHKAEGMGMYVLSNAPTNFHTYFDEVPGSEYMDGVIVSADVRMTKPNPDIFNHLLNKFGIKAEECLFVDDLKENTDGAKAVGIHGYVFDGDVDKLENHLKELNADA